MKKGILAIGLVWLLASAVDADDVRKLSGSMDPCGVSAIKTVQSEVIWWELGGERARTFLLRWGKFPLVGEGRGEGALGSPVLVNNAEVWVRTPAGVLSSASLLPEKKAIAFPLHAELRGPYLVGVHLDMGVMDFDADGVKERVHFSSNRFIYHRSRGAIIGNKPDVFFRTPDKIALEIGPFIPPGQRGGMRRAATQRALREHKMQVLYQGLPLANAEVAVLTESGWKKKIKTNYQGIFLIIPLESTQREEKHLYVVLHQEPIAGKYDGVRYASVIHLASLLMDVRMPPPEWRSKAKGFNFLAILGTGLFIGLVTLSIYRKKKFDKETMVKFDEYKITKD